MLLLCYMPHWLSSGCCNWWHQACMVAVYTTVFYCSIAVISDWRAILKDNFWNIARNLLVSLELLRPAQLWKYIPCTPVILSLWCRAAATNFQLKYLHGCWNEWMKNKEWCERWARLNNPHQNVTQPKVKFYADKIEIELKLNCANWSHCKGLYSLRGHVTKIMLHVFITRT